MGWFVVGASIFASNIGSEHVVGLAGSGAADKFPLLIYELHAWIVVMLGWVFLPFYVRSGVFTIPEFLEKRFNEKHVGFSPFLVCFLCSHKSISNALCWRNRYFNYP